MSRKPKDLLDLMTKAKSGSRNSTASRIKPSQLADQDRFGRSGLLIIGFAVPVITTSIPQKQG